VVIAKDVHVIVHVSSCIEFYFLDVSYKSLLLFLACEDDCVDRNL
jgi:hypothetical protein